ncbi:MAG: hypothetical protein AAF702_43075 [Chloroflexota bacterium]
MTIEYTHILVITVLSPSVNQTELALLSYPLKSHLNLGQPIAEDSAIKKVFHYGTMLLCLFRADAEFLSKSTTVERTNLLKPLVERLFNSNVHDQLKFQWMIHEKDTFGMNPSLLIEEADGASGGADLRG